jgi:hypothetical protein
MNEARMSKSQVKAKINCLNIRGVIMTEWVTEGHMVNQGPDQAARTSGEEKAETMEEETTDSTSRQCPC